LFVMNGHEHGKEPMEGGISALNEDMTETRFSIIIPTYNERGNVEG